MVGRLPLVRVIVRRPSEIALADRGLFSLTFPQIRMWHMATLPRQHIIHALPRQQRGSAEVLLVLRDLHLSWGPPSPSLPGLLESRL